MSESRASLFLFAKKRVDLELTLRFKMIFIKNNVQVLELKLNMKLRVKSMDFKI
ncbi:hypothetical protein J2Z42_002763 [Clostridium algifaecis]|uniref:Uncharacterized protein n=1 Tax=Clostridium algifaecis TaxID=1472040 RepID=A0ABS4KYV1_9CLOT|nr:hypothetical protein [Clostridium algifaecis]